MEVVNEMEKIIKSILWLAYQQCQIFERFKMNDNFINRINKSTMVFKISIVKFVNTYPRMKKSSLSFQFLKSNFKMIEEIWHENASEFK